MLSTRQDSTNFETEYRYLSFNVYAERGYWHMAEFDIYKLTSTAKVFDGFKGTGFDNDFAAAAYDVLSVATRVYDSGNTVEQIKAAREKLQKSYDELRAFIATGISSVCMPKDSSVNGIFGLSGHRLDDICSSGIYIVNGKKILVR